MINKDKQVINTIRSLGVDAIQKANSGHPGIVLGSAPAAYTLWAKHLKHNPQNPNWRNRDRFILSAGHGSALLYSLLHIFGYDLLLEDLKQFRQLNSKTPGHPEYKHTVGVEVTTGPLGQGIANAVGMAMAENHLASKFNKEGYNIVDHYTYALCGDGCLMEGISYEAISLAGTLGLSKLIILYDSNNITIEGDTDIAFRENVCKRFEACGFDTQVVNDGNDIEAISKAIENAKKSDKPSLIEIKTVIGYGAPNKAGKAAAHGEPLGKEEIKAMRENFGLKDEDFYVDEEVKSTMETIKATLAKYEQDWNTLLENYKKDYKELYEEYEKWYADDFLKEIENDETFWKYTEETATRLSSELVLNKLAKVMPNLFGGSADLSPSNKSVMKDRGEYSKETPEGDNIHFGIREHAMTAIANGIYLHGGLRPYIAGFFVFSDYMKPSLRLSSLMNLGVVSIFTHDSIGVGEDGPTHQPVEHLAALRSIPNYTVIRPCDTNETAAAWYLAIKRKESPTGLIFTRQNTKPVGDAKKALKGGYVVKDCDGTPDAIVIATGSEVGISVEASEMLAKEGINVRVVSMPSFEIFEEQDKEYKESVLPKNVTKRVGVEAACSFGWHKYIGIDGEMLCMESFGESAPFAKLFDKYGFTPENVCNKVKNVLDK
ncbi:transketolase [uncultured Tyzzerella sp.]|uniref:transketolase n=1 Tax=uncultured Tyzzerella sp. TaxID=2321398 RepID=UPI0029423842|nr:transketolase [uncultured Tyzzerella sp.]